MQTNINKIKTAKKSGFLQVIERLELHHGSHRNRLLPNHRQNQRLAQGSPLHSSGSLVSQEDQGQCQGDGQVRQLERRPHQQVREEGADQAGARHVQRGAHVQDARVHAQGWRGTKWR